MIDKLRLRIAHWILGDYCSCYKMGYHHMVDHVSRCKKLKEKTNK